MGRIASILTRVRDSLSDADGDRWTDSRLLRLIDEAQIEVAIDNNLLRTRYDVNVIVDINEYTLPSEATTILRVSNSDGSKVHLKSHDEMDALDPGWEIATGNSLKYIVYDKQNPGQFKVYPIPTVSDDSDTFIVGAYGVSVSIQDDTLTPDYGVVADVNETATLKKQFNSIYGIVTAMTAVTTSLVIRYLKRPAEINAIDSGTSQLEIDEMYDTAIKHYVVGMCWRDDQDTQNRALANDELAMYVAGSGRAKQQSSRDNTKAQPQTIYNNGFVE